MGAEPTDEVPDDLTETPAEASTPTGDQPDSITPESEPAPGQVDDDSEKAAPDAAPPAAGHPEEETAPPAAGHPEPMSDEGRSVETTNRYSNLDAEANHLARKRIAARILGQREQANAKMEKYSNG
jgi:hypothetical protein